MAEFDYVGTVIATGEPFTAPSVFVLRVRDGLIVESRDYIDHVAMTRARGQTDQLIAPCGNRPAPPPRRSRQRRRMAPDRGIKPARGHLQSAQPASRSSAFARPPAGRGEHDVLQHVLRLQRRRAGNRSPKNSTSGDRIPDQREPEHQQSGPQQPAGDQRDPDEALHHRGQQDRRPAVDDADGECVDSPHHQRLRRAGPGKELESRRTRERSARG